MFGTATSSITYYRRAKPDIRTAIPMALVAMAGSFGGAAVATVLPPAAFKPIIVVALLAVALFTAVTPQLGAATRLRFSGHKHHVMAGLAGFAIGFYDGMIGPGTGTFLVITLVALLGYDFLQASAKAKIVNFATNFGALLLFIPHGAVLWLLGGILAVANMTGSYLGSRMAIAKGTGFIRVVFLVVVIALIAKLGVDVWKGSAASPGTLGKGVERVEHVGRAPDAATGAPGRFDEDPRLDQRIHMATRVVGAQPEFLPQ